jgi:hypothetical protein
MAANGKISPHHWLVPVNYDSSQPLKSVLAFKYPRLSKSHILCGQHNVYTKFYTKTNFICLDVLSIVAEAFLEFFISTVVEEGIA